MGKLMEQNPGIKNKIYWRLKQKLIINFCGTCNGFYNGNLFFKTPRAIPTNKIWTFKFIVIMKKIHQQLKDCLIRLIILSVHHSTNQTLKFYNYVFETNRHCDNLLFIKDTPLSDIKHTNIHVLKDANH